MKGSDAHVKEVRGFKDDACYDVKRMKPADIKDYAYNKLFIGCLYILGMKYKQRQYATGIKKINTLQE